MFQIGVRAILGNGGAVALLTPNERYDPEYKSEARVCEGKILRMGHYAKMLHLRKAP